jgi:hypothetical protein
MPNFIASSPTLLALTAGEAKFDHENHQNTRTFPGHPGRPRSGLSGTYFTAGAK